MRKIRLKYQFLCLSSYTCHDHRIACQHNVITNLQWKRLMRSKENIIRKFSRIFFEETKEESVVTLGFTLFFVVYTRSTRKTLEGNMKVATCAWKPLCYSFVVCSFLLVLKFSNEPFCSLNSISTLLWLLPSGKIWNDLFVTSLEGTTLLREH